MNHKPLRAASPFRLPPWDLYVRIDHLFRYREPAIITYVNYPREQGQEPRQRVADCSIDDKDRSVSLVAAIVVASDRRPLRLQVLRS